MRFLGFKWKRVVGIGKRESLCLNSIDTLGPHKGRFRGFNKAEFLLDANELTLNG